MSYVQEFSATANRYRSNKAEECAVHRIASLLSTSTIMPSHQFNPISLELSKFYIDLHAVMSELPPEGDALWACVTLLQHCSRNLEARHAIANEFRFIPLLSFILKKTQAQDKICRILTLLQDLSFGVNLTWEEPYIAVLLEHLVQIIYNNEAEETNALLSLSILINLCYKNFAVKFLFLRSVYISKFSRKIQNFGMLANKMLIVLSEDIHAPNEQQLHLFLHSTFASIGDCIKTWHVPHLQHIVDFLMDSRSYAGLHLAMLCYDRYCEDIERLLNQIEDRGDMNDSDEDGQRHQEICMGLIFKLIQYILRLSMIPTGDGSENIISIDSNIPRIFELVSEWLKSNVCGVDAVNVLIGLVDSAKKESIIPRIARDPSILVELVTISKQPETTSSHITAILKLLLTLLQQSKTEKLILSKITESYFNKIFEPLFAHKLEMPADFISPDQIEKYMFCLLLVINFAAIAKASYFKMCCDLLQLPQVQYAIARAMLSGNEQVCNAIFQISQFEHFPQLEVSQQICKLNTTPMLPQQTENADQWRHLNVILKYNKTFISKEVEQRLQGLIEVIAEAHQKKQLNNVATSQIIELFNYRIEKFQCAEESAQRNLEHASNEITSLTQRINMQNAELQKYHTMNFELHVNIENLQTECKDLKEQKDNIKRNMTEQMKLLSEQKKSLQINEKQLTIKSAELIALQKENNVLNEQLSTKTDELEKLQITSKENAIRIDKLKKSIVAFELDIKEKQRNIDEKERDLTKAQKVLDELRDAKKKSDGVIAVLEAQLQEKNEKIQKYEMELNESEEVRKAIMSLMGSKKPKRSAN